MIESFRLLVKNWRACHQCVQRFNQHRFHSTTDFNSSYPTQPNSSPSINNSQLSNPPLFNNRDLNESFGTRLALNSDFVFHPRTLNLSQCQLSQQDLNILNLGFKYNFSFPLKDNVLQVFAANVENVVSKGITEDQQGNIRSSCVTCLNKFHKTNHFSSLSADPNLKDLFSLPNKLKDNNLIVTKADKGNCVVVLDIIQYQEKVLEFLGSPSFKCLSSSPLDKFITKLKATINLTQPSFSVFGFNKYKFTPINPSIPKLYGLPKIHKQNCPLEL